MAAKKSGKKYSSKAQKKVKRAIEEMNSGTLQSGRSKTKVKSRKQAIAIGLSEARAEGAKVPPNPNVKRAPKRKRKKN